MMMGRTAVCLGRLAASCRLRVATTRSLVTATTSVSGTTSAGDDEGKETTPKPWQTSMADTDFAIMRSVIAAPSPVGLEAAMTEGILVPYFESFMPSEWKFQRFKGNAGLIVDAAPRSVCGGAKDKGPEPFTVMIVGHADKIRMQVRSIAEDGKIFVDSDGFLPATLLGNQVTLFSEAPKGGTYRSIEGGTIEALGAIHFADAATRTGTKGIRKEQVYLELQIHGKDKKKQIENLGIRPGDSILLDRPIRRGFSLDTFTGAYLDNGLGCYITAEIAKQMSARGGLNNIRVLYTFATHEEIGRFGSRVAAQYAPDLLVAVDVNHDYVAAPGVADKRFTQLEMGKGFTVTHGSIASEYAARLVERSAATLEVPFQRDVVGNDTGTDAMAPFITGIDCACLSVGVPIRNMHTVSETGHTSDVLASIHGLSQFLVDIDGMNHAAGISRDDLRNSHPRLDQVERLTHTGATTRT